MRDFVDPFWAYVRDASFRQDGLLSAYWRWAKFRWQWQKTLRADSLNNPMRYNAQTDKYFWFSPP
jgi:hypothetical protein